MADSCGACRVRRSSLAWPTTAYGSSRHRFAGLLVQRHEQPLALPDQVARWSLTTLRTKLVKIGAHCAAWPLRRPPAGRGRRAKVAFCRDPAADRPAAIARAGDMTGGNQMMAAVEGRSMRRSQAEPAATSCRGAWKRLRSRQTVRIAATGTLSVDQRVSEGHRRSRGWWPSGEFRLRSSMG